MPPKMGFFLLGVGEGEEGGGEPQACRMRYVATRPLAQGNCPGGCWQHTQGPTIHWREEGGTNGGGSGALGTKG